MKKTFLIIAVGAAILIGAGFYQQSRQIVLAPVDNQPQNQDSASSTAQTDPGTTPTATSTNATSTDNKNSIANFEQCLAAGKLVMGDKPHRKCVVSDNLAYMEIETCVAPTGESMNYIDSINIYNRSQCNLEGSMKGDPYCNETTGTWWIDIQTYRKGCNPACVINVATKKSEINWRCTGAQP